MKKKLLFFRIDEQVFTTMAVLCVLAILVLAFRFKSSASCQISGFTFSSGFGFYEGSPVVFMADARNGKAFEWDFGDGSKQVSTTTTTTHIYKRAGKYTVVLLVNNQCGAVQNISIKEPRKATNNSLQAMIQAPDSATVGQPVTFADRTPNAKSWEWWFGETGTVDATVAEWTYRYSTPGAKKIILQVNGDPALVTTHDIYVKEPVRNTPKPAPGKDLPMPQRPPSIKPQPDNPPLPVPTTPITPVQQTPPAPAMSEGDMSAALEDVVTGKKDVGSTLR